MLWGALRTFCRFENPCSRAQDNDIIETLTYPEGAFHAFTVKAFENEKS